MSETKHIMLKQMPEGDHYLTECLYCKSLKRIDLPIGFDDFLLACDTFLTEHKGCTDGEKAKEEVGSD